MTRHSYLSLSVAIVIGFNLPSLALGALEAYYPLDINANDFSGNGRNGTINGTTNFTPGIVGSGAFDFNGSTNITTGVNASTLNMGGNNPKSISAWALTRSFNDAGIFELGFGGVAGDDFSIRTINGVTNGFRAQFWSTPDFDFTVAGAQNTWTHFALEHDGTQGYAYVNGRLAGSKASTLATNDGQDLRIGSWRNNNFDGKVDDVRVSSNLVRKGVYVDAYQAVSLAGATPPATGFIRDYLDTSTLSSLYYSVNNNTGNGGPPSVTPVGGINGHVTLQSRGHLNTTGQFNPSATGVVITGRWTVDSPGDADFFQVLTRSDGVPNTNNFGETTTGVEFFKQTGNSGLTVNLRSSSNQFNIANLAPVGTLNFVQGSAYDFVITDNGSQVSFRMTEVGNLSNTASVTATVGLTGAHETTDFVTFHNREGGPRTAFLENLKISSLTPTIGVLDAGYTVRSVQPGGSIGNLAAADAALANNTGVTVQKSVINFVDGGGNGHYGGDVTPSHTGDNYAIQATANLWVPADAAGTYTFGTNNDDGVRLRIDGNNVIFDDTGHPTTDFFGSLNLTAGLHTLDLVYFENTGDAALELFYAPGTVNVFNAATFSLLNIVVPEPSTVALIACAIPALLRRRKR